MSRQVALTTIDNPYDPLDDFTAWFLFDEEKGYHSCAYLGRIARTSDSLSDEQNMEEIEKDANMLAEIVEQSMSRL